MPIQNLYADIPEALDNELQETLATGRELRIERIVSRGQSSPEQGWYDQGNDEWVVLLQGAAIISYPDGNTVTVGKGDYLHIPARCRHRVQWTDPEQVTIWLAIHYTATVREG